LSTLMYWRWRSLHKGMKPIWSNQPPILYLPMGRLLVRSSSRSYANTASRGWLTTNTLAGFILSMNYPRRRRGRYSVSSSAFLQLTFLQLNSWLGNFLASNSHQSFYGLRNRSTSFPVRKQLLPIQSCPVHREGWKQNHARCWIVAVHMAFPDATEFPPCGQY